MAIEIVFLGEDIREYPFSARSLTEALEQMKRHGPEGMLGKCSIDVQFQSFNVDVEVTRGSSSSSWSVLATISSGVIQYKIVYEIPRWREIETLHLSYQTEWNRLMQCLWVHERGHPAVEIPILEEYKGKFEDLRGIGTGESARAAAEEAKRDIDRKRMNLIREIGNRREEARNRYDLETDHGRTQGVYLNLEIDRELQGSSRH